jgi:hypothetical protein
VAAPQKNQLSALQIAKKHQIHKSTFYKLIKKGLRTAPEKKPGRAKALSRTLLCMLAVWVMVQQAIGYSVSPQDVRKRAAKLENLEKPSTQNSQTNDEPKPKGWKWFRGFCATFSFLGLRRPSNLDTDRAQSANPTVIRTFYVLLMKILAKFSIATIWNMDESYIQVSKIKKFWQPRAPRMRTDPPASFRNTSPSSLACRTKATVSPQ